MQLSDITNQSGLVQSVEFWARLPYGSTGNTLKEIINRLNRAYNKVMPLVLSYTQNSMRWDDINNTDAPIGKINLVSGQNDYKITQDADSLDILGIKKVRIYTNSSATEYTEITEMFINDNNALDAMAPNPSISGIPLQFLRRGVLLYLWPNPNYSATNGIQIFFERANKNYFTVTGSSANDTTNAGIPSPFHDLLALYAAKDWIMVNRPEDTNTITNINGEIALQRQGIFDMISRQHPTKARFEVASAGNLGNISGRITIGGTDSNR